MPDDDQQDQIRIEEAELVRCDHGGHCPFEDCDHHEPHQRDGGCRNIPCETFPDEKVQCIPVTSYDHFKRQYKTLQRHIAITMRDLKANNMALEEHMTELQHALCKDKETKETTMGELLKDKVILLAIPRNQPDVLQEALNEMMKATRMIPTREDYLQTEGERCRVCGLKTLGTDLCNKHYAEETAKEYDPDETRKLSYQGKPCLGCGDYLTITEEGVVCPTCGLQRWEEVLAPNVYACPSCEGDGKLWGFENKICPACKGTGLRDPPPDDPRTDEEIQRDLKRDEEERQAAVYQKEGNVTFAINEGTKECPHQNTVYSSRIEQIVCWDCGAVLGNNWEGPDDPRTDEEIRRELEEAEAERETERMQRDGNVTFAIHTAQELERQQELTDLRMDEAEKDDLAHEDAEEPDPADQDTEER